MTLVTALVATPVGDLIAISSHRALHGLAFAKPGGTCVLPEGDPLEVAPRLRAYLDGDLHAVAQIPLELQGTPFQRQVWELLRAIPAGGTCSYGELARRMGRPGAARAVGLANRANPVCIVVPCHRVIGADGSLSGYAGGLERKRWLLDHEARSMRRRGWCAPPQPV